MIRTVSSELSAYLIAAAKPRLTGTVLAGVLGVAITMPALADEALPDAGDALVEKMRALQPELPIESARETEMEGVLALELKPGNVVYSSIDGRFLFAGDMYRMDGENPVNLTESIRAERRLGLLEGLRKEDAIVFSPVGERKAYVNVFTDVDCGYCRKLHQEMTEINALGIEVRYLAYPRAGEGSESYQKIVSAWCAEDPQQAITELKLGESIPQRTCTNPVMAQMDLANRLGVTGTPALLTEDGRLIPGYLPAGNMAEALGL